MLEKILAHKRDEIVARKQEYTLNELHERSAEQGQTRGFQLTLQRGIDQKKPTVIAEIKRASPSKGVLRENFDPLKLAHSYLMAGASCLSVLTDKHFFKGSGVVLDLVRRYCPLPILRKDFIIDEFQVYESRAYGADAILLIASAIPVTQLQDLFHLASVQGMDVVVEVHNASELEAVLTLGDDLKMIGINNRNLNTFKVDLQTTVGLIDHVPDGKLIISESGISTRADITRLMNAGVYAYLIGESLITATDPGAQLRSLLAP